MENKTIVMSRIVNIPNVGYKMVKIQFPVIRGTEKAILIRVPEIIGSDINVWHNGKDKEVWVPRSQMKVVGEGYELKEFIWEKIVPRTITDAAAFAIIDMGRNIDSDILPAEWLAAMPQVVKRMH